MSAPHKARAFLRPMYPINPKKPLPMIYTPIDINLDALSQILDKVKGRESIDENFFRRLRDGLIQLGYCFDDAQDLLARELGWPGFNFISKTCIVRASGLDLVLARRKAQRQHDERRERAVELPKIARARRLDSAKANIGRYATMSAADGQQYFFVDHPQYVEILEGLMREHTDEWLALAANGYPYVKLDWDSYHKSFGSFWRKVLVYRTTHSCVFAAPGLPAIKRLAGYLYTWNFRRYLESVVILRHASYLTREFRANHHAIVLDDTASSPTVDEEYAYSDDEDDDDNIGNRI